MLGALRDGAEEAVSDDDVVVDEKNAPQEGTETTAEDKQEN